MWGTNDTDNTRCFWSKILRIWIRVCPAYWNTHRWTSWVFSAALHISIRRVLLAAMLMMATSVDIINSVDRDKLHWWLRWQQCFIRVFHSYLRVWVRRRSPAFWIRRTNSTKFVGLVHGLEREILRISVRTTLCVFQYANELAIGLESLIWAWFCLMWQNIRERVISGQTGVCVFEYAC